MTASARLTALTRVGFAVRGLLYLVIAFLILRTGRAEDPSGAIEYLGRGGGRVLLLVIAAGLTAYGIWRLADAGLDIERHGAGHSGKLERAGAALSGLIHLFLAWQSIQLMRGAALSGDGTQAGARLALRLPGGWVLVSSARSSWRRSARSSWSRRRRARSSAISIPRRRSDAGCDGAGAPAMPRAARCSSSSPISSPPRASTSRRARPAAWRAYSRG